MILKASQRAGGNQLAVHLLRADENEHVSVHELRGFVAADLHGAFHEAYAVSRGTRAKQFLFSMSLNPPPGEFVPTEDFEVAINRAEERLGLVGQPRAIVFHEKDGRRHAHVVWSRTDTQAMKAINLPHFKLKLRDLAREIYLEHGWTLPKGFVNSKERDPLNFTLAEWQQAKRADLDPKAVKALFQECWAASDSAKAFASALQARGYTLARGDKRGYVAIDYRGEIYSISRYAGIRTAAVRDRLGDPKNLPSVEDAKAEIARNMTAMLGKHVAELSAWQKIERTKLLSERSAIVQRQRQDRTALQETQDERSQIEAIARAAKLRKGLRGLWDRLTGRHKKTAEQNKIEADEARTRDQRELDTLAKRQLEERQLLHQRVQWMRQSHQREQAQLGEDIVAYQQYEKPLRSLFGEKTAQRSQCGRAGPENER